MMKYGAWFGGFFVLIMLLIAGRVRSQDTAELAVLRKISQGAGDTQMLNVYGKMELIYAEVNSDSAIYYGGKALALARKLKQPYYEAMLLTLTGYDYALKGDFSIALNMLLSASRLSDGKNITREILPSDYIRKFIADYPEEVRLRILKGYILNNLGVLYSQTGNKKLNKSALLQAKAIVEMDRKDYFLLGGIYNNLAFAYLDDGDLDSAIYYERLNLEVDNLSAINLYAGSAYCSLADFFSYQGNFDSAWQNYYKGIEIIKQKNVNKVALGQSYISMAGLHASQNNIDSAGWYAKEGSLLLNSSRNNNLMAYGYSVLSNVFGAMGKTDSAYHYITLANAINDSLQQVKMENLHRFYNDVFDEQTRLKEQENRAVNQRREIILVFSIIGFLVMAAVALILKRLNKKVKQSNLLLNTTLSDLKAAQAQLIQSEKMASLGELTAGIAHEIQNPLNFVNNFSEVSQELIEELIGERAKVKGERDEALEEELLNDIAQNLEKITHHGKRADAIVKGMLQHSRTSSGQKEPTDINSLCDEYLRLSWHGLKAKDKGFSAQFKTDFDQGLPMIKVISQDIGRVLLNLVNNAFYAVNERVKQNPPGYEPVVTVTTMRRDDWVEISVSDNGSGIPDAIKDKIFQPFFTTKPTGQGTGLGLSLSYDIVKAHGGDLKILSKEGDGSTFIIQLHAT